MRAVLFLTLVSLNAFGYGGMGSGGGDAVVCYDGDTITSARLLDLYEGQNVFRDTSLEVSAGYQETLETALQRLDGSAYAIKTGFNGGKNLRGFIAEIEKKRRFIGRGIELAPINDSYELFIPRNCQIKQAAAYVDQGTILFDQNIWDHLSELDRAGLVLHEGVYLVDRISSAKFDSRRARRIVSLALSQVYPFEAVNLSYENKFTLCESTKWGEAHGVGMTAFSVYEDGKDQRVEFLFLDGDPILSRKTFTFFGRMDGSRENGSTSAGPTTSLYEGNDFIQLHQYPLRSASGEIREWQMKIVGSKKIEYPAHRIADQTLRCTKYPLN